MERINLYVQSAYNYDSSNIDYIEVLVRGYRGFNSVPSIMKFVNLNNLEETFDLDVLTESLRLLNNFDKLEYPIGINLCSSTIELEGIADKIITIIRENNKSGNDIIIEINEKTDFKNKTVIENIKRLRDNGIKIALDDFGVDGANLYSLLNCDIDILKVDKAFIETTENEYEESQLKILKRLLQICDDFNLKHIVEGIETTRQLKYIKDMGYSVVQGYLYEKPLPFVKFLESHSRRKLEEVKNGV